VKERRKEISKSGSKRKINGRGSLDLSEKYRDAGDAKREGRQKKAIGWVAKSSPGIGEGLGCLGTN